MTKGSSEKQESIATCTFNEGCNNPCHVNNMGETLLYCSYHTYGEDMDADKKAIQKKWWLENSQKPVTGKRRQSIEIRTGEDASLIYNGRSFQTQGIAGMMTKDVLPG